MNDMDRDDELINKREASDFDTKAAEARERADEPEEVEGDVPQSNAGGAAILNEELPSGGGSEPPSGANVGGTQS